MSLISDLELDRLNALCEAARLRDENGELRAEVADLKARLKAARARFWRGAIAEAHDALDLRRKDWRKP